MGYIELMTTKQAKELGTQHAIFANLDMAQLIEAFEATDSRNDAEVPTIRGWMMDEMERRNPKAFDAWMSGEATIPARKYFL
jgi:hypothetical protein